MIHDVRVVIVKNSIKMESASCGVFFGFFFMFIALFLHPMSPENFLNLVVTAPWQTVAYAHGVQAAVLFWMSVVLTAASLMVIVRIIFLVILKQLKKLKSLMRKYRSINKNVEDDCFFIGS
jgi:hypothetical protein